MAQTTTGRDFGLIIPSNPSSKAVKPLTISTPFYEGESMTSWLMRAAFNQGCSPLVFVQFYWSNRRLWTYDVDKGFNHIDTAIQQDIAVLANIEPTALEKHTFIHYSQLLDIVPTADNMTSKWVLPLSKRNRNALLGYWYCPLCIADNKTAYLRLNWRFSWHLYCEHHHIEMQNKCSSCGTPYQPNLLTIHQRYLNQCHHCEKPLTQPTLKNLLIHDDVLDFQNQALMVLASNKISVFGIEVTAADWFELMLFYINLVRKASKAKNDNFLLYRLITALNIEMGYGNPSNLADSLTGLPFDYLPFDERLRFLNYTQSVAVATLEEWLIACEVAGASKNSFHWSKNTVIPKAFLPVYNQLASNSKSHRQLKSTILKPTSKKSVKQAWERLKRKSQMQLNYQQQKTKNK